MSDALKKIIGIRHLPIFPLPLVMLPNELLPLHIFEDRYRAMLRDLENTRNLFGVTLFDPADSEDDRPTAGSVGCVAEIRESESLPDGRSNILVLGVVRFKLIEYVDAGEPYLVGDVEFFEDDPVKKSVVDPMADQVFALFERMANAAFKLSGSRGRLPEIQRADPEPMSFLITAAFNFENELKYRLLEMTSTVERLTKLKEILDQTVDQMESRADIHSAAQTNGHSNKKPDI